MQFSDSFKEQLRSRITLSEIVRRKVRLTQKTLGSYVGLCPFHNEKSPSFTVSDSKGMYHCFGCKASGDAISFLMQTEGLSFVETITSLAGLAGMDLPKPDKRELEQEKKSQSLYDGLRLSAEWYHRQLFTQAGKEALHYLHSRGITGQTIERFMLGYAPEKRRSLTDALGVQGVSERLLIDAGMLGKGERGEYYERFRNRIMFPIWDTQQRVIAFGGRIMGSGQPKYLNSPETAVFKKSDILYAENIARKAAHESGTVMVAEGYMDVIALHMAGFTASVAPLGTAITDHHLQRLWRLAKEPVICLDGDKAGMTAMKRVAEHSLPLLKPGYSLQFALLPQGSDPDDVVKRQGREAMQRIISSAIPLSEMLWRNETAEKKIETPDDKALLASTLHKLAETIADSTISEYYQKYFKNKLWALDRNSWQPGGAGRKYKKDALASSTLLAAEITALPDFNARMQYQQMLIALVLAHPHLLEKEEIYDELLRIEFITPRFNSLRSAMVTLHMRGQENDAEGVADKDFKIHLEKNGYAYDIEYLCGEHSLFASSYRQFAHHDVISLWYYFLNQYNVTLMESEWQAAISEMTEASMTKAAAYRVQISELEKRISDLQLLLQKED